MHHSKARLIVSGGIGLFALIGLALSFLRPRELPPEETHSPAEDGAEAHVLEEYSKQLAGITAPGRAQNEEELRAIESKLRAIEIPAANRAAWDKTPGGQQYEQWLADVRAIDEAVYAVRKQYRELAEAGRDVLRNADAPELPRRARDVLERADKLPNDDRDIPIPGSEHVGYPTVFNFPSVKAAVQEWLKVRRDLEPLTLPRRP
jgi:hypothetical protein